MDTYIVDSGYKYYHRQANLYVKFDVKEKKYIKKIIDWLIDFLLSDLDKYEIYVLLDVFKCKKRKWWHIYNICFRLRLYSGHYCIFDSEGEHLNLNSMWMIIRHIIYLINNKHLEKWRTK